MKFKFAKRSSRKHRSLELSSLEPRLLLCGAHDGGLDDLPSNLGTFPPIHANVSGATTAATSTGTVAAAGVPLTSVPALSSRPGAKATLYLDFNGDATATWGSYAPGTTPAFDQDGDATTFSTGEISAMQEIWSRVAEKYSPFNIDVTTVDPGTYANGVAQRVVIGGTGAWLGASAGGVSYVGAFANSAPNASFVFPKNLGGNAKYTSEAIAHEAGHAFGLQHQGTWSGTTLTNEYNPGTSAKAPIMGSSYSATRGLWWRGTTSQSSTSIQDDMAVISNSTNAFGYRADDYGNSVSAATMLTASSGAVKTSGVIEKTSDADYFGFSSGAGAVSFTLSPAAVGGMLDAKLELRSASGTLLSSADTTALGETLAFTLPTAGTYYVDVASHGSYGDVGQYTLSGSVVSATPVTSVAAPTGLTATPVANSTSTVNLKWTDNATNETAYVVQRSTDGGTTWSTLATLGANAAAYTDSSGQGGMTYSYRVCAASGSVNSAYSNPVSAQTAPPAVMTLTATATSSTSVKLQWANVTGATGYAVDMYTSGTGWARVGSTTPANPTFVLQNLTAGATYQFRVAATNATGYGPQSAAVSATLPNPAVPAAPSNLALTAMSSTQIRLDWKNNATNATGIIVEQSPDGVNWSQLADIPATYTAGVVSSLNPGMAYWFRLKAYNASGASAYSNVASASTPAEAGTAVAAASSSPFSTQPIRGASDVLDTTHGHARSRHTWA